MAIEKKKNPAFDPQVPPAERNVVEEHQETGLPITDPDRQRAFGGPDFAHIPEDLPGHDDKQRRADSPAARAAREKEEAENREREEKEKAADAAKKRS